MQAVLSTDSSLVFVWHDNAGQALPSMSDNLQAKVDTSGFTINISAEADIPETIIIFNSTGSQSSARNTINIGAGAKVQIVEYLMSDDNNASNNIATVINCADRSQLKHCILHHAAESANITQQSTTHIKQQAYSNVFSNVFAFGGKTSRVELAISLEGTNATCNAGYLAYTHGTEAHNVVLKIDHCVPHCNSASLARAVLKDQSSTDFVGRIEVHPDARKSFADLQIKNILCSPKAQANNRPELEIYNDDVHCSHGSSTGQINEEALFYMRSRGLDEEQATAMIIDGFIQPVIESCTIPAIADFVRKHIKER